MKVDFLQIASPKRTKSRCFHYNLYTMLVLHHRTMNCPFVIKQPATVTLLFMNELQCLPIILQTS